MLDEAQAAAPPKNGGVIPDDKILRHIAAKIEEWWPRNPNTEKLHNCVAWHRYTIESAWILKALKRIKLKAFSNPSPPLLLSFLSPWLADGATNHGMEDEYDDDLNRIPMDQRGPRRDREGRLIDSCLPTVKPGDPRRLAAIDKDYADRLAGKPILPPSVPAIGSLRELLKNSLSKNGDIES